jgi:hypothetical protein
MADDLKQTGNADDDQSILRAATDELGLTTPKEQARRRHEGPRIRRILAGRVGPLSVARQGISRGGCASGCFVPLDVLTRAGR